MKAFTIDRYGAPLRKADVAEPALGPQDVLVEIEAASINPVDEKIRTGEFKRMLRYEFPLVLGNDLAGVVTDVGSAVRSFAPGDHVYASPNAKRIGTFADYIAVAEDDLALKPASLSMEEAAALPLVALTAWQALVERGNVQPGQKVLIHGGAGGVGSIAMQLAKHLGAEVATTVSSKNAAWVRELGADITIDYRTQDFTELLHDYDFVLDSLGADNVERSLRVLRPGGKVVGIAGPPDPAFARDAGANWIVRLAIAAMSRGIRRTARKLGVSYEFLLMQSSGSQLAEVAALVDAGALRPIVAQRFAFDDTPAALASLTDRQHRGKIVVSRA